jgi:hypothetical protein
VNLVKDDEAILVRAQEERWIGELLAIFSGFEVEVKRARLLGDGMGERRLADLAGSEESHRGLAAQGVPNLPERAARNHLRILNTRNSICKVQGFFEQMRCASLGASMKPHEGAHDCRGKEPPGHRAHPRSALE